MKRYLTLLVLLILVLGISSLYAQPFFLPVYGFLDIPHDAQTTMNAGALTGIPSDNPQSFISNPAQLGIYGSQNRISVQFSPVSDINTWISDNITLNSTSFTAGYSLKNLPVGFGISYMHSELDLGKLPFEYLDREPRYSRNYRNSYSTLGFGLSYDLVFTLSAGYSHKWLEETFIVTNKARASDFGILASNDHKWNSLNFGYSVGFAVQNYGDKVDYTHVEMFTGGIHTHKGYRNLPTNRSIGYGLSIGYMGELRNQPLELIRAEWSVDARKEFYGSSNMKNILSKNLGDHFGRLLLSQAGDQMEISQGLKLIYLESITLGIGQIYQKSRKYSDSFTVSHPTRRTLGVGFHLTRLLSIAPQTSDSSVLSYINKHINVSYTWSTYLDKTLKGTNLSAFVITFHNF